MSSDEERPFLGGVKERDALPLQQRKNKNILFTVSVLANIILSLTCLFLGLAVLRFADPNPTADGISDERANKHELIADPYC